EVIAAALSSVREAFGWTYGSYWEIQADDQALHFVQDAGSVSDEFRRASVDSIFREGEGLIGRAWQSRDLVFISDRDESKGCARNAAARRGGVKFGMCFPILIGNHVVGTMDFLTDQAIAPSESRLDAVRNVGRLVSAALDRVDQATRLDQAK